VIARVDLLASVLAATDRVVEQAGDGDWAGALKTSANRHQLLEQLAAQQTHSPQDSFLHVLRAAAAEADAALVKMSRG
jgi:hypothetical protein